MGRAEPLSDRLKAHTFDRLNIRWDCFSWFGIRGVEDSGSLNNAITKWNSNVVIETMEALLIESLEPPLNRRRGNNFAAVEYVQVPDPNFDKKKKSDLLKELASKL